MNMQVYFRTKKTQINGTKQHIFKDGTWSYYRDRQSINKYKISYFPELGVFVPLLQCSLLPGRCLTYISANSGFPEIFVLCLFIVANKSLELKNESRVLTTMQLRDQLITSPWKIGYHDNKVQSFLRINDFSSFN